MPVADDIQRLKVAVQTISSQVEQAAAVEDPREIVGFFRAAADGLTDCGRVASTIADKLDRIRGGA